MICDICLQIWKGWNRLHTSCKPLQVCPNYNSLVSLNWHRRFPINPLQSPYRFKRSKHKRGWKLMKIFVVLHASLMHFFLPFTLETTLFYKPKSKSTRKRGQNSTSQCLAIIICTCFQIKPQHRWVLVQHCWTHWTLFVVHMDDRIMSHKNAWLF